MGGASVHGGGDPTVGPGGLLCEVRPRAVASRAWRVLLGAEGDFRCATMTIPRHDELFRPLLELATKQDLTRRTATEAMCDLFQLTMEERSRRLPSGSATYTGNRTGWAMTFLTKGRLIEKVARSTYRATASGRAFLAAHPTPRGRGLDDQERKAIEEANAAEAKRAADDKAAALAWCKANAGVYFFDLDHLHVGFLVVRDDGTSRQVQFSMDHAKGPMDDGKFAAYLAKHPKFKSVDLYRLVRTPS